MRSKTDQATLYSGNKKITGELIHGKK